MKTKRLMTDWITELSKALGLTDAREAWLEPQPELALARAVQVIPVKVLPEARFTPRINFRRPPLDSLRDAGGFARIERSLRVRRPRPV